MHWINLIHEFHNLSWITEINELFHVIRIYWDAPVLTFVASGLDINVCVLSYFEGTANVHCYTSCTLTTLHCRKVKFLQCCHMKRYNKIFTKMWGVYFFISLLQETVLFLSLSLSLSLYIYIERELHLNNTIINIKKYIYMYVFWCVYLNKYTNNIQNIKI